MWLFVFVVVVVVDDDDNVVVGFDVVVVHLLQSFQYYSVTVVQSVILQF